MFESIIRFFTPADWQLVKSVESPMRWGSEDKGWKDGSMIYHLYESDKGGRKYEMATTFHEHGDHFNDTVEKYAKTTYVYQKRIFRWLKGRHDPSIPKYDELGEEDLANELKGDI